MKKYLFLFYLAFFTINVINGQHSFVKVWGTPLHDVINNVIENNKGDYIICGSSQSFYGGATDDVGYIYKLNKYGDSVSYKTYSDQIDTVCQLDAIHQLTDTSYLLIGRKGYAYNFVKLWVLHVNANFDTIKTFEFNIPNKYDFQIQRVASHSLKDSNIVIAATFNKYPLLYDVMLICKFNQRGNLLKHNIFDMPKRGRLEGITYSILNQKYYLYSTGYLNQWTEQIIVDTNFNLLNIFPVNTMNMVFSCEKFNENLTLLNGIIDTADTQIATYIVDTNHQIMKNLYLGKIGVREYAGYNKGVSFVEKDKIFTGGTHKKSFAFFPTTTSNLLLAIVDSNLNVRWETLLGGDAYYEMESILATSDGGCLVVADRFDYNTQVDEYDILIQKIYPPDSLPVFEINEKCINDEVQVILSPNPCNDILQIMIKPAVDSQYEITDIRGKMIKKGEIRNGKEQIKIHAFQKGIYFLSVKNNSEVITKKWIKL